jgi:predicted Zn-dependent peptidase
MLDRTKAPAINPIEHIHFVAPERIELGPFTELLWVKEVDDEAVKIDFVFDAGKLRDKKIVAELTGELLLSGTPEMTSTEFNEAIDLLGGFVNVEVGPEDATVSIYGLTSTIAELIALVMDAIINADFSQKEFEQELQTSKQGFLIDQEKVSTLARRAFVEKLLGNTDYGRLTQLEDFSTVDRNSLLDFHAEFYQKGLMKICVVGNIDPTIIEELVQRGKYLSAEQEYSFEYPFETKPTNVYVEKDGAVQTAIRVGRIVFNRKHEDYISFSVLNTIFGGYFGSRLMSNIREDKGYTYGIGSGIAQFKESGYFFISTEVGKDVADAALAEIKKEMERLRNEVIPSEELELVRSYSIGKLLKGSDGPFAMMDRYLAVERFGMDLSHYDEVIQTIRTITPEKLQELANKYFIWEEMVVVKAG